MVNWNSEDFVLSADAQFNGVPYSKNYVSSLEEYIELLPYLSSQYQVVVNSRLPELVNFVNHLGIENNIKNSLHQKRTHETISKKSEIESFRYYDELITGYPVEFYQSMLQKPQFEVDIRGRHSDLMREVKNNIYSINDILDYALERAYDEPSLDNLINAGIEVIFNYVDPELKGIISGYLRQKPSRTIMLFDIEPVNKQNALRMITDSYQYFDWMESTYQVLKNFLEGHGINVMSVVSGKGYHFITSIPLYEQGHMSSAMLNLLKIGGNIKSETMDKLVTTHWGSRKSDPIPLLSQRAYQGVNKLMQYIFINTIDEMRYSCISRGFIPNIGFTDNKDKQISLDITSMTRQIDMSCFGSAGSVYNKTRVKKIVRIPRMIDGKELFDDKLDWMLYTRENYDATKQHLINSGARIPVSIEGINNLISGYLNSRIKHELHDPLNEELDHNWIIDIKNSNYEKYRLFYKLSEFIDYPNPSFLDPEDLEIIYGKMLYNGKGSFQNKLREMVHLTAAIYFDEHKSVEIDEKKTIYKKYSATERAFSWPMILHGEYFKGWYK